jgi:hypothetical protein
MFFKKSGALEETASMAKGEVHVGKYIPFGVHIAPDVVKLRENGDPSQVNNYPIDSTLREQCVTQIFLPNPGADYDDYVTGFKLTEAEFDAIKNLAPDSRTFLVKQGERSTVCNLKK